MTKPSGIAYIVKQIHKKAPDISLKDIRGIVSILVEELIKDIKSGLETRVHGLGKWFLRRVGFYTKRIETGGYVQVPCDNAHIQFKLEKKICKAVLSNIDREVSITAPKETFFYERKNTPTCAEKSRLQKEKRIQSLD